MVRPKMPADEVYPSVPETTPGNRIYLHFREYAHTNCNGTGWVGDDARVTGLLQDFAGSYYNDRRTCSTKSLRTYCKWVARMLRLLKQVSGGFSFTLDMSTLPVDPARSKSTKSEKNGGKPAQPKQVAHIKSNPEPTHRKSDTKSHNPVTHSKSNPEPTQRKSNTKHRKPVERAEAMASPTAPAHRYISLSDTAQSSLSSPSPSQQPLAVSYTTQLNQGALVTRRFRVQVGEKAYYRHADLFMEVTRVLAATTGLSSHECRSLAFEMYRGLVCRAVYGEKGGDLSLLSFPSRVDKAWQFAILNTRLYVDFCADVFGEYVHYSTADVGDVDEADRDARVQRALAQYTQVWSEHPPLSLWTPFTEVAGASSIPDASGGVTGTQRNHVLVPDVEVRPHASVVDKKGPKRRDRGADQDNSEDEPLNKLLGQDAKSKPDRGRPKKFLRGPKVSQQSQQYNDVRQSDVAHGPNVVPDTNSGLDPSGTQALEGNNLNAQDNATMKAIYDQQLGPKQSAANGIVSTTKPPKLEFKVSNERGEFVRFNVSPNTRLEKVMTAYCNLNGLEPGTVVFVMRESGSESNISGDDTVRSLDLEGKTVYIQTR